MFRQCMSYVVPNQQHTENLCKSTRGRKHVLKLTLNPILHNQTVHVCHRESSRLCTTQRQRDVARTSLPPWCPSCYTPALEFVECSNFRNSESHGAIVCGAHSAVLYLVAAFQTRSQLQPVLLCTQSVCKNQPTAKKHKTYHTKQKVCTYGIEL